MHLLARERERERERIVVCREGIVFRRQVSTGLGLQKPRSSKIIKETSEHERFIVKCDI